MREIYLLYHCSLIASRSSSKCPAPPVWPIEYCAAHQGEARGWIGVVPMLKELGQTQPMKVAACTSHVDSHHIRVCFKQALPGGQEPHLVYDAWHIFGASVMYLEQK